MQANIQLEGKYKTQEEEGREAIEGTTQHTHICSKPDMLLLLLFGCIYLSYIEIEPENERRGNFERERLIEETQTQNFG